MKRGREKDSPLRDYTAILEGKSRARYLACKKTPSEKPRNLPDAWKEHGQKRADNDAPSYSLLELKSYIAEKLLSSCTFCEHRCKVNRRKELGFCKVGKDSFVSSAFVHLGEEPELVPSGTIFFSGCNFHCCFCQNWEISQDSKSGYRWNPEMIATWINGMRNGIRNVNLVGGEPTPHLHTILRSLLLLDVNLPIIWNSNMYMSDEAMSLLDGVIDLYLSDFKYGNDDCAEANSGAKNYFSIVARNHLRAHKDSELLIRHLVLPGHSECCSKPVLEWVEKNLGPSTRVNLMGQYKPEYKAKAGLGQKLDRKEYDGVARFAKEIGLNNLLLQPPV